MESIQVAEIVLHRLNDGSYWAEVEIDRATNVSFCLALCLLERDLTNMVTLTSSAADTEIHISKNAIIDKGNRGEAKWIGSKCLLQITPTELGYWLRFFLEYYRDGISSVDHIDFETNGANKPVEHFGLVLSTEASRPPMSPEELIRIIGAS